MKENRLAEEKLKLDKDGYFTYQDDKTKRSFLIESGILYYIYRFRRASDTLKIPISPLEVKKSDSESTQYLGTFTVHLTSPKKFKKIEIIHHHPPKRKSFIIIHRFPMFIESLRVLRLNIFTTPLPALKALEKRGDLFQFSVGKFGMAIGKDESFSPKWCLFFVSTEHTYVKISELNPAGGQGESLKWMLPRCENDVGDCTLKYNEKQSWISTDRLEAIWMVMRDTLCFRFDQKTMSRLLFDEQWEILRYPLKFVGYREIDGKNYYSLKLWKIHES